MDVSGPEQDKWLAPQDWRRQGDGPCIALGASSAFDDMHIFAPCVAYEDGQYRMWYCGSRGQVGQRVFRLGLATSADGVGFAKHPDGPVFELGDGRSILTPTLLRHLDGSPLREDGHLRLWFTAADLSNGGLHTLHQSTSEDGLSWAPASPPQLDHAYAPTVVKDGDTYRLWYTDVEREPWCFRHAVSRDGTAWDVHPDPVLQLDQPWEAGRLFYPTVIRHQGLYLMWYGSYWGPEKQKTALGLAISRDGVHWQKSPNNPVYRPDPSRAWESHYTTSQSLLRHADGRWRIWYGARTRPPFVHKYYAVGTAVWDGP